jgi:hypothetical protein
MGFLLRYLRTRGLQRGVFGSSRAWLGVWIGLTLAHQLNKRLGKDSPVVQRVVLQPGQAVEIVDTGVPWKDDPEGTKAKGQGRRGRRSSA